MGTQRRFADEIVDAVFEGLGDGGHLLLPGQQHDVGEVIAYLVQVADVTRQLEAVHDRHDPVGDDDIGRALLHHLQGLGTGFGETDVLEAAVLERLGDDDATETCVVHHQDR